MSIVIQIVFGWPGMILSLLFAVTGIYLKNTKVLAITLGLSLPSSLYFLGANNWIMNAGLLIPLLWACSILSLKKHKPAIAWGVFATVSCFYAFIGYLVLSQ